MIEELFSSQCLTAMRDVEEKKPVDEEEYVRVDKMKQLTLIR